MSQSLKIVFFGNEHLATGVESQPLLFNALLESQHKIVALVVHSSEKTSRNTRKEPIIKLAEEHEIPVFNPSKTIDCIDQLRQLDADCGVLAAYGKMVPEAIIDIFPHGIINLHPSLLPKLRGSTPIESAILNGMSETGVSIMKLVVQMDAGPVYAQESIPVAYNISKQVLADQLHELGKKNLLHVLDIIDEASLVEQDESDATFCSLLSKSDGIINWQEPAEVIERKIRSYSGWPGSWTVINGLRIKITKARVEEIALDCGEWIIYNSALYFTCGDGRHLRIEYLQPENKKEMPIKAFLAGYSSKIL